MGFPKDWQKYDLVDFVKYHKRFKMHIQPKILELIEAKWRVDEYSENLRDVSEEISLPLSHSLTREERYRVRELKSFLGKYTEFLVKALKKEEKTNSNWVSFSISDQDMWERVIAQSFRECKQYYYCKNAQLDAYIEEDLECLESWEFWNANPDQLIWKKLIEHLKGLVSSFHSLQSYLEFGANHRKRRWSCEISGWEFDFFDSEKNELIELKFSDREFNIEWVCQTLLYVYLVKRTYGLDVQRIKILNTYQAKQWSWNLKELFVKGGLEGFFELLDIELNSKEKESFCSKAHKAMKDILTREASPDYSLEEIVRQHFALWSDKPKEIERCIDFFSRMVKLKERAKLVYDDTLVWTMWLQHRKKNRPN
ncbi:hypothetical protein MHLP_00945 [Candidatus Mycoplasma haematolamae str. Purdue]|uniref:Uncharacterized protein n=1 Tax=Mycoplasma haematolamae (strain Purdue) TaxID=1212765 RepID=I7CIS0_MYCHA|nr:hypothetical protein [Candidatus Mycoplasma haematolamae]AFO51769.1 hypothetical protein MHLP_00945 [Candidatus Mycoplasma haematolamae str. Purdue]